MHSFAPVMLVVLVAMLAGGCPPPPLSLDEPDARGNAPPGIDSVRDDAGNEFVLGLTNLVIRGQSTMTLQLFDPDVGDTLYVRGFLNYVEGEMAPRATSECEVAPSADPTPTRTIACFLGALCGVQAGGHFDIVVSDRVPDDTGEMNPRWWACTAPCKQAMRSYEVTCQDMQ